MDLNIQNLNNSSLAELYLDIFAKCSSAVSGTWFLASEENRSGQVVIHNGQLLGISYGGEANSKALESLLKLQTVRHSFTPELIYPVPETLFPEDARDLLEMMGWEDSKGTQQHETVEEKAIDVPATKTVRIYRGQVVS